MESDLILYSVNAIRSMEVVDISTGSKLGYIRDFKVDLETNKMDISTTRERIVKDAKYDILGISKPELVSEVNGGYSSKITIKNISDKDIGSVVLEVAELNDENEYTNVTYLDSYEVIKKSQDVSLSSVHSNDAKKLEVIGYIYDDVKDNTTVEVNLKLNEVILLK